jgi:hypothetical protein
MKPSDNQGAGRPKKKSKGSTGLGSRWVLLVAGIAVVGVLVIGVLVIGLAVWGVARFMGTGGLADALLSSGAVAAAARPAGEGKVRINPSPNVFPAVNIPITGDGWKVAPDAVPPASGLASAVVLPDGGRPMALLFAEPARARAAVILGQSVVKPKEGAPIGVVHMTVTAEWLRIDLKSGAVAARVPLGTHEFISDPQSRLPVPFDNSALSPSGDRLAAIVPKGKGSALTVWDAAGKVVQEWADDKVFAGQWLAFPTEDRVLASGTGNFSGRDVTTGQPAFTSAAVAMPPFVLSPGRKWLGGPGRGSDRPRHGRRDNRRPEDEAADQRQTDRGPGVHAGRHRDHGDGACDETPVAHAQGGPRPGNPVRHGEAARPVEIPGPAMGPTSDTGGGRPVQPGRPPVVRQRVQRPLRPAGRSEEVRPRPTR